MVILRPMRRNDIEDNVRWFTTETEWGNWDAPWEPFESDEQTERQSWTEYYEWLQERPGQEIRHRLEIEQDGVHIGWVSWYTDLGYMDNPEGIPAIGIDIPETVHRKSGSGTEALRLFMDYLRGCGFSSFYTQTWSGNLAMMRVAEKLGFREVCRKKDYRIVNGKTYDAVTFRKDV